MTTEIKDGGKPEPQELLVPPIKAGGWLAWVKTESLGWMLVSPGPRTHQDWWRRHPSPLHATREEAVATVQGTHFGAVAPTAVKVFRIDLD